MHFTDAFPPEKDIGIVTFPGMTMLDVAGPAEVFARASGYRLHYLSPTGGTVRSSSGIAVADTLSLSDAAPVDTLIVAGADDLGSLPDVGKHRAELLRLIGPSRRVASVCTGSFILAELGLLDGRRATTHWNRAGTLARRFPRVEVEEDVVFIRDGRFFTSGGITTGIDLALALVEDDHGAERARDVARDMIVFMRRTGGQSQFSDAVDVSVVHNESLRRAMAEVVDRPAGKHTLQTLADSAHLSTRHLSRLMQSETGKTPARWIEKVRLDAARRLLSANYTVANAAELSGFGSDETMRRVFRKHLDVTPTGYREQFRGPAEGS